MALAWPRTRERVLPSCAPQSDTASPSLLTPQRPRLFCTALTRRALPCCARSALQTQLLSRDLDSIRSFVFSNTARDRGLRAALEALGTVCVLFFLRWVLVGGWAAQGGWVVEWLGG